jgi:hypothetical protein
LIFREKEENNVTRKVNRAKNQRSTSLKWEVVESLMRAVKVTEVEIASQVSASLAGRSKIVQLHLHIFD